MTLAELQEFIHSRDDVSYYMVDRLHIACDIVGEPPDSIYRYKRGEVPLTPATDLYDRFFSVLYPMEYDHFITAARLLAK